MVDKIQAIAQKRDHYLQILQRARQLNDRILVRLILKKLTRLGMTEAACTADGCTIIPFPTPQYEPEPVEYERPTWWLLFKLTLAIPGSLVALMLLAHYRMLGPPVF